MVSSGARFAVRERDLGVFAICAIARVREGMGYPDDLARRPDPVWRRVQSRGKSSGRCARSLTLTTVGRNDLSAFNADFRGRENG
jgi:hypothetical protein